jgi:putative exporter of polyketide antibiotics
MTGLRFYPVVTMVKLLSAKTKPDSSDLETEKLTFCLLMEITLMKELKLISKTTLRWFPKAGWSYSTIFVSTLLK